MAFKPVSKNRNNYQILTIIVLIVIALVLGGAIFKKIFLNSNSNQLPPSAQNTPNSQNQQAPNQRGATLPTVSPRTDLTADEKQVLNVPVNGTQQQREQNLALAQKLAVKSETLNISSCHPVPVVLGVMFGQDFIIKNTDSVSHSVAFNQNHVYTIPANGQSVVKADFGHNSGLYGYGCDASNGAAGLVLVSPSS